MKTGVTISTAALIVLLAMAGFAVSQSEAQEAKIIRVRRLNSPEKLKEWENYKELRGKAMDNPMMLKSASAVKKLLGKEAGEALTAGVDFGKDMIVIVFWETGGPPCGWLNFEVKGNGLNFYMQGPCLLDKRGVLMVRKKALWYGVDFFLITRDVAVDFEPGERPYGRGADAPVDPNRPNPPGGESGDGKKKDDNNQIAQSNEKIREAGYDQQQAADNIAKDDKESKIAAGKNQDDAIRKLEEAKRKLERLLKQVREEEMERVLAALLARCEKMLRMQQAVLADTERVDASIQKNADKKPVHANKAFSINLAGEEKKIVEVATKCIDILEAEGSAVAFPEVFQQVRDDMLAVQRRLELVDPGQKTQIIEKDVIDNLKEIIDALKKARDELKDPGKSPPGSDGGGQPGDQKLLELIQELKMVRSLQKRVNDRTRDWGKAIEQANDPATVRELRNLSERQRRIQEIVDRIAKGDNK